MNTRILWAIVALAGIWIGVAVISIFSPDMVTGSQQEHYPIAAIIAWIPGASATRSVMNAMVRRSTTRSVLMGISIGTVVVWLAATLVCVFGPVMVTGTDPTRLPFAAVLAPIGAAVATGFVGDFIRLLVEGTEPEAGSSAR